MSTELEVTQNLLPTTSSIEDMVAHVNLIQTVMRRVMKEGQHFGVVPGCGDKPALLKAGAEKILEAFRLAADPIVEDLSNDKEIRYRVKVRVTHQGTGAFIGAGIGECSTEEEKYKWRSATSPEFNATPENMRRGKWKKGYNGKPDYEIKQVRTNPSDLANTVLKMAKKRGLVDAALTATAASDIFAQDIEDFDPSVDAPVSRPPVNAQSSTPVQPATLRTVGEAVAPSTQPSQEMTLDQMKSEIKDFLETMHNGSVDQIDEHVKGLTTWKDKASGQDVWLNLPKLLAMKENKRAWIGKIHEMIRENYQEFSAKQA